MEGYIAIENPAAVYATADYLIKTLGKIDEIKNEILQIVSEFPTYWSSETEGASVEFCKALKELCDEGLHRIVWNSNKIAEEVKSYVEITERLKGKAS